MVWVGRSLKVHLAPAPSSLALGAARDGAPTTPPGSLHQGLAAL